MIIDPAISRPLDVHRWSDHPETRAITNAVWNSEAFEGLRNPSKGGPKPKTRFKDQLRVVIVDLYVCYLENPEQSLGVSMRMGDWPTNSRYNALHLSNIIPDIVHRLHEAGYIELAKGSYSGPGAKSNRTTRIRAATLLHKLFARCSVTLAQLEPPERQEMVVLRDAAKKEIEYEDTPRTIKMRKQLAAYNALLWNTFIDLPSFDDSFVERPITSGDREGQTQRVPIGGRNYVVRRVFSRCDWDLNGRFYGGWWQQLPKVLCRQIHINDEPTIEIDYKGLHVAILSQERDVVLQGDPYDVGGPVFPPAVQDQRQHLKTLVLTAINAKNERAAFAAFRSDQPTGSPQKALTNGQLSAALNAFVTKHPHLENALCSDQGIRLMKRDADMAANLINAFTDKGIPVLCVHDSFICAIQHEAEMRRIMPRAAWFWVGDEIPIEVTLGATCHDPAYDGDDVHHSQVRRTKGYQRRQRLFRDVVAMGDDDGVAGVPADDDSLY